jgi:SAM-dependent methyltransferase
MEDARADPRWWNHQRHPLIRLRRQIEHELDATLRPAAGDLVVDIGCGDMPYQSLFESRGARYLGCDIDGPAPVRIIPEQPIPLDDGCANVVVSFQVLEHVWDLAWYLGECRRLLRPGGRLLLSTHGTHAFHPSPADYWRWTHTGLERLFRVGGEWSSVTVTPGAGTTACLGLLHVHQDVLRQDSTGWRWCCHC